MGLRSWLSKHVEEFRVEPEPECGHEVPCLCDSYLQGLSYEQLLRLRVGYSIVVLPDHFQKSPTLAAIPIIIEGDGAPENPRTEFRRAKNEAKLACAKIDRVLHDKFRVIFV